MQEWILNNESTVRVAFFAGTLLLMGLAEVVSPKRKLVATRPRRWLANMGIVFVDSALVRLLIPILPVALAATLQEKGIGLFNMIEVPAVMSIIATVVIFDLVVYWQHVVFHRIPILWRLHKVHHTDMDLDVTSGNRFHPVEIFISLGIKCLAVVVVGPLPVAVIIFEVILNGMAQFNHSNVEIGGKLDRILRTLLVTPDVHRVHHSVLRNETDSNFGFNLSIWDKLFGTYIAQPKEGHQNMTIGIPEYRQQEELSLFGLLAIPFKAIRKVGPL